MLCQSWSRPRKSLLKKNGVGVNETEGDEFGEPSRLALYSAQHQNLLDPVLGRLGVAVHQGGSRADPASMGRPNYLLPLVNRKFVARKQVANFVIEDFRCRSRKRVEAVVAQ